ncbi:hypothetical protein Tco_1130039 [Tanacetum coccineum]
MKNDSERLQAKCKGNVPSKKSNVSEGNISHVDVGKQTRNSVSQDKNKMKGKSVNLMDEDKRECHWKFQVDVSKTKAFRAKAKTEVQLRGDQEQQYALLRDYCDALKKANLNTTVKIDVYRAHNPHENVRRFKRIYVCLGALKDGFRASKRQSLGLDRAFMKGNYPGQMLTAVSVDANNGIYSVAYDDLDLEANSNFTFITDRQKGLLPALKDLFPAIEHIYCVRHFHDNMNLIYKGGQYKELLWKCATATTEVHFEEPWSDIQEIIISARDSPVITALEYVREYLMKRIVIVQKVIEKSQGPLTPTVTKIFNAIKEKASQCVVVWNGADLFQVNEGR